jgi:hypothetical protein
VGVDSHVTSGQKFPGEKGMERRRASVMQQPFCRQNSERSIRTFSRSHRKMLQQYTELTIWPARTNSWLTITLI